MEYIFGALFAFALYRYFQLRERMDQSQIMHTWLVKAPVMVSDMVLKHEDARRRRLNPNLVRQCGGAAPAARGGEGN